MKKHILFFCFAIISLTFGACNKDDDKLDPQGDCFTANIDGEFFESDNVTGTFITGLFDFIGIGATFGTTDVPTFGINLLNLAEGTYSFANQSEVTATYAPAPLSNPEIFGATSGSLTIQEHDTSGKRIKGTFEFEGVNSTGETIQVTEGIFDLGYQ